jgi:hypothetical protein
MEANVFIPQSHTKKKKCGWKPGTLSTLNTKELLLHMDVNKEKFLNIEIHESNVFQQNNPTKREW